VIKFWPSRAPGKGVCGGAKFLARPYYSQRAVFAYPSAFYPRDVVSSVFATATWLAGWLSVSAGIVSKRLNLS